MLNRHSFTAFSLTVGCALLLGGLSDVHAQQIYRTLGADGRVSFSDRPAAVAEAKTSGKTANNAAGSLNNPPLPYELREVVSRYPFTLFTSATCAPCATARTFLIQRGVPYAEKTVSSNQDIEALQQISGESSLPFATVGRQQLKGFSDTQWAQFLDAAGYPTESKLPSGYRNPAPEPFIAVTSLPASPALGAEVSNGATGTTVRTRPVRPAVPTPAQAPNSNADSISGIRF